MRDITRILSMAILLPALACGGDDDGSGGDGDAGGGGGMDGGGGGMDSGGAGMDSGVIVLPDGRVITPDGGGTPSDGGWGGCVEGECIPVMCQSHLYACGDGMDNDGDGRIDAYDPDCLGPCDNNEEGFDLLIPGGDSAPCALDCYYDQDQGPGNDMCLWDHRCDPLEPDHNTLCMYQDPPPPSASCPDPQVAGCHDFCGPLTPNGCDCFGCCELPAGSGEYVFIGTVDSSGVGTCSLAAAMARDHEACHPCTPVADCLNDCGDCELCLGRTTLPPECTPPPPGTDAGPLPDGAVRPDGGVDLMRCEGGEQPCGTPGDALCPAQYYCITGCCVFFG